MVARREDRQGEPPSIRDGQVGLGTRVNEHVGDPYVVRSVEAVERDGRAAEVVEQSGRMVGLLGRVR